MRIRSIEDLHCNAGWRDFSFLKISTDDGLTGWSEYMELYGSQGLTAVIRRLGERLIGQDPRPVERHTTFLHGVTRAAPGGVNQQAIAAIENALVDLKARRLGIPVYELLGGPVRERLPLYWSHCGSYQVMYGEEFQRWTGMQADPLAGGCGAEGAGGAARGFTGLKTNIMRFDGTGAVAAHARLQRALRPRACRSIGRWCAGWSIRWRHSGRRGRGCRPASGSELQLPHRGL